jgi:hypothetical protein
MASTLSTQDQAGGSVVVAAKGTSLIPRRRLLPSCH